MNITPDVINGIFEVCGALFISLSIHKVLEDKEVKGVSWLHSGFFTAWGFWNLYFYPSLDQMWSFYGGVTLVVANAIWLALLIYYSYHWEPGEDISEDRGHWKETYTGMQFYLMDPQKEEVVFEDVAHSLAHQCRYTGHCLKWYSVAEHCCLLADYAKAHGHSVADQYEILMHDAAEAYTGDISRPLKYGIPGLRQSLTHIDEAIAAAFGCQWPEPNWLRKLDARMIRDERMQNMIDSGNDWNHDKLEPLGIKLKFWGPEKAKAEFTRRYTRLRKEMEKANG